MLQRKRFSSTIIRFLTLILLLLDVLTGLPGDPAAAASAATISPTELAVYFPADTAIYFSAAADPATIEALDMFYRAVIPLLGQIGQIPPEQVPPNLPALLDLIAQEEFRVDFRAATQDWLGDGIAFGGSITPGETATPVTLVAVRITDKAAASAFFASLGEAVLEQSEAGDYTVFVTADATIAIGPELLFLAPNRDSIPLTPLESNLAGNTAFAETVALLPAADYRALLYVDGRAAMETTASAEQNAVNLLLQMVSPMALGLTTIEGHSLAVDIVQNGGLTNLAETYSVTLPAGAPIDEGFWSYVPADASLVVHTTSLTDTYYALMGLLRATVLPDIDKQRATLEVTFEQLTTLSFHQDIIDLLTGNYVIFLSYTGGPDTPSLFTAPLFPTQPITNQGLEMGIIIEVTDPDRMQLLVTTLAPLINSIIRSQRIPLNVTREEIGGSSVLVLSPTTPGRGAALEIVIGANSSVLVIGTRGGATAALTQTGALHESPHFNEALALTLANRTTLIYVDPNLLNLLGDNAQISPYTGGLPNRLLGALLGFPVPPIEANQAAIIQENMRRFRDFSARFHSATFSTFVTDTGGIQARLVVTVAP